MGLISYDGEKVFANEHVIGQDDITVNGTPDIRTDVGTNGKHRWQRHPTICGDIRHGVGKEAPNPTAMATLRKGTKNCPK